MNYCPDCGVATSASASAGSTSTRSERAGRSTGSDRNDAATSGRTDRDVLEQRIARATRGGWRLENDFGDHAVMVRRTVGSVGEHLAIAVLTIWFTMGIGNALWGAYRYVGDAERMVLRPDTPVGRGAGAVDATARDTDAERSRSTLLGRATAVACLAAAALIAALGAQFGPATFGSAFVALAAVFAVLGIASLPSVRRRLERRRSIAANGRVRSVDERSVIAPDRPCTACSDAVGRGVERIYREERCFLGVPLTVDEGHNSYCRRCANGDVSGVTVPDVGLSSERHSTKRDRENGSDSEPKPESTPDPAAERDSESTHR